MHDLLADGRGESVLNKYSLADWDALYAAIGYGGVKESQVVNRLEDEYLAKLKEGEVPEIVIDTTDTAARDRKKKSGISVTGVGDINVRFSKCCTPVPGDEIVGFVTRGRGVSIHRTDCPNILNLEELEKQRIVEAEWQLPENSKAVEFRADIKLTCDDRMGLLVDISRLLTNENMSVKSLNARTVKNAAVFNVGLSISSKDELERISNRLLNLQGVNEVERVSST